MRPWDLTTFTTLRPLKNGPKYPSYHPNLISISHGGAFVRHLPKLVSSNYFGSSLSSQDKHLRTAQG